MGEPNAARGVEITKVHSSRSGHQLEESKHRAPKPLNTQDCDGPDGTGAIMTFDVEVGRDVEDTFRFDGDKHNIIVDAH